MARRHTLPLLAVVLTLVGAAGYLWTAPGRQERALRNASFSRLIALSKREPNNGRVFYYLGLRLRNFGQLPPARAAFERAAALNGGDEEAWLAWAATAGNLGSEQEAFSVLRTYTKTHPRSARAHMALALFYYNEEAMDHAYDEAMAAAKITPRDATAWRLAGTSEMSLNLYARAEAALRQAVAQNPHDWRNVLALGEALDAQGRGVEALAWYRKADMLAPNEPAVPLTLGQALLNQPSPPAADVAAAQRLLEHAVQLDPPSGKAHSALGRAYVAQGRWPQARAALEQAERLSPNASTVHFQLQKVYQHLGETSRATQEADLHERLYAYEMAKYNLLVRLHEFQDDMNMRLQYARLCASHGEYGDAAREYRHIIARAPRLTAAKRELEDVERRMPQVADRSLPLPLPTANSTEQSVTAMLRDADTMYAQKRYGEAETAYLNVLAHDNANVHAGEGLGLTYFARGKSDEAFRTLNHVLALAPTSARAQFIVARIYYDQGFPDEAMRRLQRLTRQEPGNAQYAHALGSVCAENSAHYGDAVAALRAAATLAPNNAGYRKDLAQSEEANGAVDGAERDYRRALQLSPGDETLRSQFGCFLAAHRFDAARQQEAARLLRDAVARNPDDARVRASLGGMALRRGNVKEAIRQFQAALAQPPGAADVWYQLARAYDRDGQPQQAAVCRANFHAVSEHNDLVPTTEEQVNLHPKDTALRLKLARLYAGEGQNAKAINQYQMCLAQKSQSDVAQELAAFVKRLQAAGQMPNMDTFDEMLRSATRAHA